MKTARKIRFNEPYVTGNELGYIEEVFRNKHFHGNGPFTQKAQEFLQDYLGAARVLLTDSCTSALEISALLLKRQDNDEVILPSYTFSSTASAFARAGYKLIFAEIDPLTMMIDPADVAAKLSDNTRAIVPVHYAGFSADLDALGKIAADSDVLIVEDAAQGLGTSYKGKMLGTHGIAGCISFHETKNIHAGLAGALVINDEALVDRATCIWERGTNRQAALKGLVDKYTWVELGGSFYPTEFQAAFLLAQLESLEQNLSERHDIYDSYLHHLAPLLAAKKVHFLMPDEEYKTNYHAFAVTFNDVATCDRVRMHLVENDVAAYIGYVPLHSSPVGISLGYKAEDLPITEEFSQRILRLPLHNNLTLSDVKRVCALLEEAI
jgi:dTDP-4-amino-4,6-dideoxygalactose transaminase